MCISPPSLPWTWLLNEYPVKIIQMKSHQGEQQKANSRSHRGCGSLNWFLAKQPPVRTFSIRGCGISASHSCRSIYDLHVGTLTKNLQARWNNLLCEEPANECPSVLRGVVAAAAFQIGVVGHTRLKHFRVLEHCVVLLPPSSCTYVQTSGSYPLYIHSRCREITAH